MKKKMLAAVLAALLVFNVTACGNTTETASQSENTSEEQTENSDEEVAEGDEVEEDVAEFTTSGGYPWICSDLQENLTDDMELSLNDDFHLYNNYEFLMNAEIPDGYTGYGSFDEVYEATYDKALAVLTDDTLEGHDAELVQTMYSLLTDWDTRDELGVSPIQDRVDDILSISSLEEYSDFLSDPERCKGVACLLGYWNDSDMYDSSQYITYLYYDGFILGDAAEYSDRTEQGDRYYDAYLGLTQEMLSRFGFTEDEAKDMFDDVIDFESQIAEVSFTSDDYMSPDIYDYIYNVYTPEELFEAEPNLPLQQYAEEFGYGDTNWILVTEPDQLDAINELYTEDNLEVLKEYSLIKYVIAMSDLLDRQSYEAYNEAVNYVYGSEGIEADEEMAYNYIRSLLPGPIDRAYLEAYDATETQERITELCLDVCDAYEIMLSEEDWLSEETKAAAIEKLDNLTINAVFPDKWDDTSSLDFTGLTLVEAYEQISDLNAAKDVANTNGTVDTELWGFDILEANAYYSPYDNSINIILGLLDYPFYYEEMSDEELLGSIGMVIGHEISHAFDTSGAQFDKDGNYNFWWTDEDYEAFTDRAQALIDYYNAMDVWEGQPVIGDNIQTEAIADMGGMKAMLILASQIEDFDYDLFFTSYANVWKGISTYEMEYYCLTSDTHPLNYLRTNCTVQQFQEFYDTYGIEEGDGMYLAPEDRVAVW